MTSSVLFDQSGDGDSKYHKGDGDGDLSSRDSVLGPKLNATSNLPRNRSVDILCCTWAAFFMRMKSNVPTNPQTERRDYTILTQYDPIC